jgi:hypothetical protein
LRGRKIFKVGRLVLEAGEGVELRTRFSLAVHTTRLPKAGHHVVDIIVNGRTLRAGSFEVR